MAADPNTATQATTAIVVAMIENKLVNSATYQGNTEETNLMTADNVGLLFEKIYAKVKSAGA